MNRRTFLASSVLAVPSASVAALTAAPAIAPDPALAAYAEWRRLYDEEEAQRDANEATVRGTGSTPAYERRLSEIMDTIGAEVDAARDRLLSLTATTPAGMLAQIAAIEESDFLPMEGEEPEPQDRLIYSLRRSLKAMAEGNAA